MTPTPARRSLLLAPVAALGATLLPGVAARGATSAAGGPVATTSVTPTTRQTFGLTMPGVPGTMAPLEQLSAALGRRPDVVMWYVAWSARSAFPAQQAAAVASFGARPVITWEPWDPAVGSAAQPAYSLRAIGTGAHDAYVTSWARQIRAYGRPVTLRFAHEMNGTWYPWAAGANGNTAAQYVTAWQRVRAIFARERATNASWSWCPNVPYPGSTALTSLYPGDGAVDEVGLDGYNWAGRLPGTSWTSFQDVFADGVGQLRSVTAKPLYVGEVGTGEVGGDKAAWVRDMFAALAAHPEVAGFTWFDYAKEADWRLESSQASFDAFRAGLATY